MTVENKLILQYLIIIRHHINMLVMSPLFIV